MTGRRNVDRWHAKKTKGARGPLVTGHWSPVTLLQALHHTPELDGAEFREASDQLPFGPLDEDPAGGPVAGPVDEMEPAGPVVPLVPGLEVDTPARVIAREVAQVPGQRRVDQRGWRAVQVGNSHRSSMEPVAG